MPGTKYDYEAEAGDISLNSIVAACLQFYIMNWPQARPRVSRLVEGSESLIADHPLVGLLTRPDPTMPAIQCWEQIHLDWWIHGNAYLYKRRGAGGYGEPFALQWLPADMVDPVPSEKDPNGVVYHYRVWGQLKKVIDSTDIIHLRMGRDPQNHLRGRSYLLAGLREIAADNAHSTVAGSMSRNNGVASWMIAPKGDPDPSAPYSAPGESEADTIRRTIEEKTRGDQAGSSVVLTGDFHAERMSFSPDELALDVARATPEERVCALFHLPPLVVGMGAGLRHATMANYKEARQQAWEDGILPLLDVFSSVFEWSLLPDFTASQPGDLVAYDTSRVRALRDDESAKVRDAALAYRSGMWDRETSKVHSGKKALPEDAGLYVALPSSGGGSLGSGGAPPAGSPASGGGLPTGGGPIKTITSLSLSIKNAQENLLATAKRQRTELIGASQGAAEAVTEILATARESLAKQVVELEAEMVAIAGSGSTLVEGDVIRLDRYQELLRQAQAAFNDAAEESGKAVAESQVDAALMGAQGAEALVQAMGIEVRWTALPVASLRALAGTMGDGTPIANHFQTLGPGAAERIRTALTEGIAAGKNPRSVARAIEGALGTSYAQAETIARTETIRVYREASRRSYESNGVKSYVRLSAADSRTCAACWALHGTEQETSQIMPSHPNCRCVMVPVIPGGPNVPDQGDAFDALSETDQKKVLGVQGHQLWKDGVPLSSFAIVEDGGKFGPTARVASLAELGGQGNG